jgi:hypothetical protein
MSKIRKSQTSLTIRVIPSERRAVEKLAELLGCNLSDAVKYALYETLQKANIPVIDFKPVNQPSQPKN